MVHCTSLRFIRLGDRPTYGYSQLGDQPYPYISRSSSQHSCQSDSRPTVEDSRVVDRLSQQSTKSWMHGQSGQASLLTRLDNTNLTKSTLNTNGYMWTRSSQFHGSWLDIEAINSRPLVSLSLSGRSDIIWRYQGPI